MFKNLKEFKEEFRIMCLDPWNDTVDIWLEAVGHMHRRNFHIPKEWEYNPGKTNDGTEQDCWAYDSFELIDNVELVKIANFMFRYLRYLEFKGIKIEYYYGK